MYKLYSMQRSGNSYKVRLALALLDAPYRAVEVDILRGESRTPDFLAKNPSGQVPLLETAPGRYLAESNAILWYLAVGTSLAPDTRMDRAEALQWMFFEQHALEPNIGSAYFWLCLVKGGRDLQTHALEDWLERGYAALQVMENHLKSHDYFAAGQLTIADIALMPALDVKSPRPDFSGGLVSLHVALILLAYGAFGLGSAAGVYVRLRGEREIKAGDILRLGEQIVRFDSV